MKPLNKGHSWRRDRTKGLQQGFLTDGQLFMGQGNRGERGDGMREDRREGVTSAP